MRALTGLMVVGLVTGCNCGFEPVDECSSLACRDAGPPQRDAGTFDGGARDGGSIDAGTTPDAGTADGGPSDAGPIDGGPDDAGLIDAGPDDAGASDAGASGDGGCLSQLLSFMPRPGGDYIRVEGTAGSYGQVDYFLGGQSAGVFGQTGMQRFTNDSFLAVGVPAGLSDTGLWMWTGDAGVVAGALYAGDNDSAFSGGNPFIDFRIYPGLSCPMRAGSGWFRFTTFIPNTSPNSLAEGEFDFQCPPANISVHGCFHYDQ